MPRLLLSGVRLFFAAVICFTAAGCQQTTQLRTSVSDRPTLDDEDAYLEAHLFDGTVYVYERWTVEEDKSVTGQGARLDLNRDTLEAGQLTVPIDSVAIFQTNVVETSPALTSMAILTGLSAAVTVACLTNPKACFGSCPTFYVADRDTLLLRAEGFSSSIAPSLAAIDVDHLWKARHGGTTVTLEMRNEAYETQVVRQANVLAVPRSRPGRTLAGHNGTFWSTTSLESPRACRASEGDCLEAIYALDGEERFSLADSVDLAAREVIDLRVVIPEEGPTGLVIGVRQGLLSTFLLYQGLAWAGHDVGQWIAALERREEHLQGLGTGRLLGGIDVLVPDGEDGWQVAGTIDEHGPLATDVHLVRFPDLPAGTTEIRLRLTKGAWRLDYVALATLKEAVEPVRLAPHTVLRGGVEGATVRSRLEDPYAALTTMPGDTYTLVYSLPEDTLTYDLFLESEGYYLEWMRQEWLSEHDPDRLMELLFRPEQTLQELAPVYKSLEPSMEAAFWQSRYAGTIYPY